MYLFIGWGGSLLLHGFSVAAESRGYSLVAVPGLCIVVASLVECRPQDSRASVVEAWARCLWLLGSKVQIQ